MGNYVLQKRFADMKKHVYIISFYSVLLASPNLFAGNYSDIQDLIKNLNNTLPLIGLLISNYVVFKYKHADSRKAANVLIANSVSDPKKKLEELLGVDVRSVEKVSK